MKKILIVAMADSVHTARWLDQFRNQELSVLIFPSGPHRRVHPLIKALLDGNQKMKVMIAPTMRTLSLPLYVADTFLRSRLRSAYLRYLITEHRAEVVHALEMQHSGYLAVRAISKLQEKPEFRLSIWGSDLVWFSKFGHHKTMIRNVLGKVDKLSTESQRDIDLAKSLGFVGEVLPILPASGGLELSGTQIEPDYLSPSKRKKIMIKGYSGFVGRALTALKVLEALAYQVKEYEIHVYSASVRTMWGARRLAKRTGLRVICHQKYSLSHQEVMSLFQQSRISISISLSDGFPGSLREAMVSGCFPIESSNSCGNEWAIPHESASFVNPLNDGEIVKAIQRALNDDTLVDIAAKTNWELAKSRFSTSSIERIVDSYYLGEL